MPKQITKERGRKKEELWTTFNLDDFEKRYTEITVMIPPGYRIVKSKIKVEEGRVIIGMKEI